MVSTASPFNLIPEDRQRLSLLACKEKLPFSRVKTNVASGIKFGVSSKTKEGNACWRLYLQQRLRMERETMSFDGFPLLHP